MNGNTAAINRSTASINRSTAAINSRTAAINSSKTTCAGGGEGAEGAAGRVPLPEVSLPLVQTLRQKVAVLLDPSLDPSLDPTRPY
eukprot:1115711-Rhodomonas_salina.2